MCDEYKKLLLLFVMSSHQKPLTDVLTEIRELNLLFIRNGLPYQEIDQLIKYPFNATSLYFQLK